MHLQNKIDGNISKIVALFPNCVTEAKDENGEVVHKIDFEQIFASYSPETIWTVL